jgi:hypothetical protein
MQGEPQIWIDEELQLIRQKLAGDLTEEDALRIINETTQCAVRLKNPRDIRILVDGREMHKGSPKARKLLSDQQKKADLTKLAFFGMHPVARTIVRFFNMATGMTKMQAFSDEKSAIEWLRR